MAKIDSWLDANIDHFFDNEVLRNHILKKSLNAQKEVYELLAIKRPEYLRSKMKEILANYSEKLILKRRIRIRQKHIDTLNRNTDIKMDYRLKTLFLESEIETVILWYKKEIMQYRPSKYSFDYLPLKKELRKNREIPPGK